MPIDPVFVLTVVILAFGGLAAALAWADSQDRGPGNRARCADVESGVIRDRPRP